MLEKILTGIYIRVSTEDQAKDGFSINAQKEKLTKYAEANDWVISGYYIDDGISGKNLSGRPEVMRMLEDVKKGKINNILIYKLDRLTRSTKDLIYLIELFEKYNCTFNSQTEKIDTSNAVGRMFVKIIGIFAEFERENLAERVSLGYEQKTREGNYTNCNGVYGYDYIKGEQKLVVNYEEKELVNKIYNDYIDGKSYLKIAQNLNMLNIQTKRGGVWAPATIKSILTNPLYLGIVRYGLSKKNKDKFFTTNGNDIEPIVSIELWNKANNISKTRTKYKMRRYSSDNAYYFHTLICSRCGGKISARQQKQNGKMYITYRCNNAVKGACDSKGFSHKNVDKVFLDYLENIEKLKPDKSIIETKNKNSEIDKTIEKLKIKQEKLNNKKKLIRDEFINDTIDIDEYRNLIKELDEQINILEENINKESIKKQEQKNIFDFDEIKDIITNIKLNFEYLTNKERKQFLEQFVEYIKLEKIDDNLVIKDVEFKK